MHGKRSRILSYALTLLLPPALASAGRGEELLKSDMVRQAYLGM